MLPSLFLNSDTPTPPAGRTFTGSGAGVAFSFFTSYTAESTAHVRDRYKNAETGNTDTQFLNGTSLLLRGSQIKYPPMSYYI